MTRNGMRSAVVAAGVAACVLMDARPSAAPLVSREPIADLVAAADAVVVATLEPPASPTGMMRLRLAVKRTLKGTSADVLEANAPGPLFAVPGRPVHGLWFLRKDGASHVVLPHRRPAHLMTDVVVGLPDGPAPEDLPGAGALDRVASELLAAIRSDADAATVDPAFGTAFDLVWTVEGDRGDGRVGTTTGALPALAEALDAALVARVETEIAAGRHGGLPPELLMGLWRVADPATVPAVARIVRATRDLPADETGRNRSLHRGAVEALKNIHSEETLPVLAELLDSPEIDIRHTAVMAFGAYANGYAASRTGYRNEGPRGLYARSAVSRHMPATGIFRANPDRYVAFWRRWFECLPCRLEKGTPSVVVTGEGTCSGLTCTLLFRAAMSDPDGDNTFVERWSGCEDDAADSLECATLAGAPGPVEVSVLIRDSYGDKASGTGGIEVYPAGHATSAWSTCTDGRRTRRVTATALTVDPLRAVSAPPAAESCAAP